MALTGSLRALAAAALALGLTGCTAITITPPQPTPTNVEEDEDFGTVMVYTVGADGSLDPRPDHEARRVWEFFEQIVTPQFAESIMETYLVGDSADSDTLAYVYRDSADPSRWNLAANLAYADDRETLLETLVHEYGHVLSLSADEVPPFPHPGCETIRVSQGCADADSALWAFQTEFWDAYGPDAPRPGADHTDLGFYHEHSEEFVDAYASTDVSEDFAETFASFVLEDRPDDASDLAPKFTFFYDRPDYVAIRDRIRSTLGL